MSKFLLEIAGIIFNRSRGLNFLLVQGRAAGFFNIKSGDNMKQKVKQKILIGELIALLIAESYVVINFIVL